MVTARFTVRDAGFVSDADSDYEALVLSEYPEGAGRRVEFHRTLHPDTQDSELGWDTHSIADESGANVYGAISGWQHVGHKLTLSLTPKGASVMGVDRYELTLRIPNEKDALISRGLASIVGSGLS